MRRRGLGAPATECDHDGVGVHRGVLVHLRIEEEHRGHARQAKVRGRGDGPPRQNELPWWQKAAQTEAASMCRPARTSQELSSSPRSTPARPASRWVCRYAPRPAEWALNTSPPAPEQLANQATPVMGTPTQPRPLRWQQLRPFIFPAHLHPKVREGGVEVGQVVAHAGNAHSGVGGVPHLPGAGGRRVGGSSFELPACPSCARVVVPSLPRMPGRPGSGMLTSGLAGSC